MLWRWELGDPAMAASSPAGIPLTDHELATQLAFFLTDQPPDDTLLAAARAGRCARTWGATWTCCSRPSSRAIGCGRSSRRTSSSTRCRGLPIDPAKFPFFSPALVADLGIEARKFLDNALWNGNLTDLLLSRTAFLNSNLATMIYMVPVPAGRDGDDLRPDDAAARPALGPADQRRASRPPPRPGGPEPCRCRAACSSSRRCSACPTPGPARAASHHSRVDGSRRSQQQVAYASGNRRSAVPAMASSIRTVSRSTTTTSLGRYRTVDDLGRPIDAHATLPAAGWRRRRGECRGARAEAGDQSRVHELHGAGAAAVRDGRSRHQLEVPLPRSRRAARPPTSSTGTARPTARHSPTSCARRPPRPRFRCGGRRHDVLSFSPARVHHRRERGRRPQDHAAQPGRFGAGDAVAGAPAGHALADRDRGGQQRRAVEADVGQRGRFAGAQAVRRRGPWARHDRDSRAAHPERRRRREEGGMVALFTGIAGPGTRAGLPEADDAYAGGPSFDQILLRDVPALQRPGQGYANSIADSRTDFGETAAEDAFVLPRIPGRARGRDQRPRARGQAAGAGVEPARAVREPLWRHASRHVRAPADRGAARGQARAVARHRPSRTRCSRRWWASAARSTSRVKS